MKLTSTLGQRTREIFLHLVLVVRDKGSSRNYKFRCNIAANITIFRGNSFFGG